MTKEQWEVLNPLIFDRLRAMGYLTEHAKGNTGKGRKMRIIDEFDISHGHNCLSLAEIIVPDADLRASDVSKQTYYAMIEQLRECIVDDVDVISLSMSGERDRSDLKKAIQNCEDAGIIVVCSSGNYGNDLERFPAAYPTTISCGSIDNDYLPSDFETFGDTLTCVGFGQNIPVRNPDGNWVLKSGTSFSTPVIAATVLLAMEYVDDPTPANMREYIQGICIDLGTVEKDDKTGFGFPTLDIKEFEVVKSMIFGWYEKGLSWRVLEIKSAMIENGMSLEDAEALVNPNYHIIGYEDIEGIKIPIYGGRK